MSGFNRKESTLNLFDGNGKGTFTHTKPAKKYDTNPIITMFGSINIRFPFIISTIPWGLLKRHTSSMKKEYVKEFLDRKITSLDLELQEL